MHKFQISLAATLLLVTSLASATLEPVSEALELSPTRVTLPSSQADTLIVRGCITCKPLMLKVSAGTIYRIGSAQAEPVQLGQFRSSVRNLKRKSEAMMMVEYVVSTNTVTEVIVFTDRK